MKKLLLITAGSFLFSSCTIIRAVKNTSKANQTEVKTTMSTVHTIPFEMEGGHIIIAVKTGDKKSTTRFVIDTGAPTLFLEKYARANNLISDSSTMHISTPVGGEKKITRYIAKDVLLELGDVSIVKPNMNIIAMTDENNCYNYDGFIGSDVLSEFNVTFDFQKKEMQLRDKKTLPEDISTYTYTISFDNYSFMQKTPQSTFTVNGNEIDFIWDTGYNGAFYQRFNSKKKFDKWVANTPEAVKYENFANVADAMGKLYKTTNSHLFITDTISFKKMAVSTGQFLASSLLDENMKVERSNIGLSFMENYRMVISWDKKKIYLKETGKKVASSKLPIMVAGYEAKDNNITIRMIATNSEAYKKGVRANSEVVSIGETNSAELIKNNGVCDIRAVINKTLTAAKTVDVIVNGKKETIEQK